MNNKSLQELFIETENEMLKHKTEDKLVSIEVIHERLNSLLHQVDMLFEYVYANEEDGLISYRLQDGSLIQTNLKDFLAYIKDFSVVNKNVWDVNKYISFVKSKITHVRNEALKQTQPLQIILIKEGAGML